MAASVSQWNAKYRAQVEEPQAEPAGFVRDLLPLLPLGPALDLACGTGRHALLLASRHQPGPAGDSSGGGLGMIGRHAGGADWAVRRVQRAAQAAKRRHGIQLWQADLEEANLPAQAFSLVLCMNYLQRSLFSQIERTLVPGGVLLFETYTVAQLEFAGGPRNPNYLLESGELRTAFPALRSLFYRELRAGKGIASLIAKKPQ